MIRKGKKAEFTICKKAKLREPVSAQLQCPKRGRVCDGLAGASVVKCASVYMPALKPQAQKAAVYPVCSIQRVQAVKLQESVSVMPARIKERPVSGEPLSVKKLHCRTADKDITIQSLFHTGEIISDKA